MAQCCAQCAQYARQCAQCAQCARQCAQCAQCARLSAQFRAELAAAIEAAALIADDWRDLLQMTRAYDIICSASSGLQLLGGAVLVGAVLVGAVLVLCTCSCLGGAIMSPTVLQGLTDAYAEESDGFKGSYHITQYRCLVLYDHWFPPPLPPIDERAPASPFTASTQRLALAKALHHRLGSNSHAVLLPWDLVSSVEDLLYDEDYTPASFEADSPSSSSDDDDIIPIDEVAGCGPQIDSYDHDDIRFVPILHLYDHDDISSSSGDE